MYSYVCQIPPNARKIMSYQVIRLKRKSNRSALALPERNNALLLFSIRDTDYFQLSIFVICIRGIFAICNHLLTVFRGIACNTHLTQYTYIEDTWLCMDVWWRFLPKTKHVKTTFRNGNHSIAYDGFGGVTDDTYT